MSFTIIIEQGLHAGAVQRLGPGIYTIGSELSADIVLSDPGVEPIHVILEFDDIGLRLEPAKGSVAVDGETGRLEPGDERHLTLPASFHIGDAAISVRAPKDVERSRHRKRLAIGAMVASVLVVIGLYAIGPLAGSFSKGPDITGDQQKAASAMQASTANAKAGVDDADTMAATETMTKAAPDEAVRSEPLLTVDEAAAELRDQLATAELDAIDVIVRKDHLVADGSLDPEKMTDWQTVQIWFDGSYGHKIPLMTNVEASEKAKPPKLAIEAIWTGSDPYLMAGGRRYFEGADLGNGWTIERIHVEQIMLRRGDQTYAITL